MMAGCGPGPAPAACVKESELVVTVQLIPLAIVHVDTGDRLTERPPQGVARCGFEGVRLGRPCPGVG